MARRDHGGILATSDQGAVQVSERIDCPDIRTTTTKRVLQDLSIDREEPPHKDEIDDMWPPTGEEIDETCDAYCFELLPIAGSDPLGLQMLSCRLRWGPDWHEQDYTKMTDEYIAVKLNRSLADVIRLMAGLLDIRLDSTVHILQIRDSYGEELRTYNRLGWTKAHLVAHIR